MTMFYVDLRRTKSRALWLVRVIHALLLLVGGVSAAVAQDFGTARPYSTADLDADCLADTLYVERYPNRRVKLVGIAWGVTSKNAEVCDQARQLDDDRPVRTLLVSPEWMTVWTSIAIVPINQDTIPDIYLTYHGVVAREEEPTVLYDTSTTVVIYGQRSLSRVESLNVIGGEQRRGDDSSGIETYAVGTRRSSSGRQSLGNRMYVAYKVPKTDAQVDVSPYSQPIVQRISEWRAQDTVVRVHPNPVGAGQAIAVTSNLPDGLYTLRLVNTTGDVLSERLAHLTQGRDVRGLINHGEVPSGTYQIQIIDRTSIVGTKTIIILH